MPGVLFFKELYSSFSVLSMIDFDVFDDICCKKRLLHKILNSD